MLRMYNKILDRICDVIKYFIASIIMLAIIVAFIEVVRRYFFSQVFVWSDEFIRFCIIYVGLVGGAAAYRYGQLVCFDSLLNRLGPKGKFILGVISDTLSLVLLVVCFVLSVRTVTSRSVVTSLSTGMKIPMTVPYMAFVIGFFLMILFCVGSIANRIAGQKNAALKAGD